jgi:hypothetical protein
MAALALKWLQVISSGVAGGHAASQIRHPGIERRRAQLVNRASVRALSLPERSVRGARGDCGANKCRLVLQGSQERLARFLGHLQGATRQVNIGASSTRAARGDERKETPTHLRRQVIDPHVAWNV